MNPSADRKQFRSPTRKVPFSERSGGHTDAHCVSLTEFGSGRFNGGTGVTVQILPHGFGVLVIDRSRSDLDAPVVRAIVGRHQFWQDLDVRPTVGGRKILVHLSLERSVEPLYHAGLRFVLRGKKMDVPFLEKGLKLPVEKFSAFIGLQHFWFPPAFQDLLETVNESTARFILEWNGPGIF